MGLFTTSNQSESPLFFNPSYTTFGYSSALESEALFNPEKQAALSFQENKEGKYVYIGGSLLLAMRRCIGEEEPSSGNFMVPLTALCRSANEAPLGAPNKK